MSCRWTGKGRSAGAAVLQRSISEEIQELRWQSGARWLLGGVIQVLEDRCFGDELVHGETRNTMLNAKAFQVSTIVAAWRAVARIGAWWTS
jgi:hypothetical protein